VKFVEHLQVVQQAAYVVVRVRPDFLGANVFENWFRLLGVVPKIRLVRNAFFVFYFGLFAIVVKDTSSKPPHGLSCLSTVRWSWLDVI
jgi:hypothetical protein